MAGAHIDQTIEELFRALRALKPDVLIALRDGPHERAAIEQWARTHWLNSPLIDEFAGFDAASLHTLHAYGLSCQRLHALELADPTPELYREIARTAYC
jgi:hypothetical protein